MLFSNKKLNENFCFKKVWASQGKVENKEYQKVIVGFSFCIETFFFEKTLGFFCVFLEQLTSQKVFFSVSKKDSAKLNIRKNKLATIFVTLRGAKKEHFLEKWFVSYMPKQNFIQKKKCYYNLTDLSFFPEIERGLKKFQSKRIPLHSFNFFIVYELFYSIKN